MRAITIITMSNNLLTKTEVLASLAGLSSSWAIFLFNALKTHLLLSPDWINKTVLINYSTFPSLMETYIKTNTPEDGECLVCINKTQLEGLNNEEKVKLIEHFTDETNRGLKITLKKYVNSNTGFYVSCVPNMLNGIYVIKSIGFSIKEVGNAQVRANFPKIVMSSFYSAVALGAMIVFFRKITK